MLAASSSAGCGGEPAIPDAVTCRLPDIDTGTRCTSGRYWTDVAPSPRMRPGAPCIACHEVSPGAPRFVVAGTVFPTLHEPTDCFGASGPVVVRLTGADGLIIELPTVSTGNFFTATPIAMPIRAELLFEGRSRVMCGAQPSGDCNGCHTEEGNEGAPGRIMMP